MQAAPVAAVSAHEALLRAVVPVGSDKQPVGSPEGGLRLCYQAPDSRERAHVERSTPCKSLYIYRGHAAGHADSLPQTPETLTVGVLYRHASNIVSWTNCVSCVGCVNCVSRASCVSRVSCVGCAPGDNAGEEAV